GALPIVVPFGEVAAGGRSDAAIAPGQRDPVLALGFGPDSLGERILRTWLSGLVRPIGQNEVSDRRRFLVCVLKEERGPLQVDARISDRSRGLTLLHVAEAP